MNELIVRWKTGGTAIYRFTTKGDAVTAKMIFENHCGNEIRDIKINALEQQPCEDYISNYIKHKIDYLEDLASIETNEGRWREEEKYLYTISVLEEVVEYMNTSGGGEE